MERNKAEAVKAMRLSQMRSQEHDFAGARDMARIAHRLFPEDESISQVLALAEVHYSIFESGENCQTRDTAGAEFEQLIEKVRRKRSNTDGFESQLKETFIAESNGSKPVANSNSSEPVADSNSSKFIGRKSMADYSGSKSMASMRKTVPTPEFNKFVLRKDVLQKTFKANQIWVLYDPADGMPRRYACIRKVLNPGFRVKITWLEPDPDDQDEVNWCRKNLPVACGKFGLALTEEVTDHTVFSHEYIPSKKGKDNSAFQIYPRKGETWALYQDWDLGWSSEPEKHSQYEFDYVELVSDFSKRCGAGVAHLGKVKGFVSLFEQAEQHGVLKFQVRPNELYKFSHQIPSRTMSGCEGYGIPTGCFEFDPAALPARIFNSKKHRDSS